MSFGFQMFNSLGANITDNSRNVFIEEFIPVQGSGSKYFQLNEGEKLDAFVVALEERGSNTNHAVQNISVSGGTVSWDTVYGSSIGFYIVVTKSGVY